jgi:formylglycine-generating enzyme
MRSLTFVRIGLGVVLIVGGASGAIAADKDHGGHKTPKAEKSAAATPAKEKDMVVIPRGEFSMGSKEHADEPAHNVVLDAYAIDKFEVSNEKYKAFINATGHPAPAYWDDPRLNKLTHPVVGVNWNDATAFCKWEGKRLPTEAEWERAAKGPDSDRHYPWDGHELSPTKANYGQNYGATKPIDSFPEGVSGYGLYNMAGNVFEWVQDWYDPKYYKNSPALNPEGPDKGYNFANQGQVRVLRGGSWLAPETSLHTSHRFWNQPENNSYGVGLGFRCAKPVNGSPKPQAATVVNLPNPKWLEGRDAYMQALISMGQEKHADAMASIEKAIQADPSNKEYKDVQELIRKNLKK